MWLCEVVVVVGIVDNVNTAGKGMVIECHASKAPIHKSVVLCTGVAVNAPVSRNE
jgi:hypothetical protein